MATRGTKYPTIADVVSSGEGGYNSINRGRAGDTPGEASVWIGKNLNELTIREIRSMQKAYEGEGVTTAQKPGFINKNQGKDKKYGRSTYGEKMHLFAVGRYQFIPSTLESAIQSTGISRDAKFDEITQNILFDYLLDEKQAIVGKFIKKEIAETQVGNAVQALAREFASVGLYYPENGKQAGQSRYAGTGNNRASISPQTAANALIAQRTAGIGAATVYATDSGNITRTKQVESPCGVNEFSTNYFVDIDVSKYQNIPVWVLIEVNGTFKKKTFLHYFGNSGE